MTAVCEHCGNTNAADLDGDHCAPWCCGVSGEGE